jgi:hypothetical protein
MSENQYFSLVEEINSNNFCSIICDEASDIVNSQSAVATTVMRSSKASLAYSYVTKA